jgi:hypothetical protein
VAATDAFNEFLKLDEGERKQFFSWILLWLDLHLGDEDYVVIPYRELERFLEKNAKRVHQRKA